MGRLDNKIAIVTGAGTNLGLAIATRFVDEGAQVAILDLDGDAAAGAAEKLGSSAQAFTCDVTDETQVKEAVAAVVEAFGSLHVLVNNAGVEGPNRPTHEFELAD